MNQRQVGNSSLSVSEMGLGCNNFGHAIDAEASTEIIHRALEQGVTLFDTAPIYGSEWGASEKILGRALGSRRKDVVIVTKFGLNTDGSPDNSHAKALKDVDESLQRLGTDYIDLLLLHWPDGSTSIEEILQTLEEIVKSGKARYVGCSNLPAWRVVESKWLSRTRQLPEFIVAQDEYNLINRQAESNLLPALAAYDMSLMPYGPLANGLLTGKFAKDRPAPADSRLGQNVWRMGDRYLTEVNLDLVEKLSDFAEQRGHSLLELAIAWLLSNPSICSVIAGATRMEQFKQNMAMSGWRLSADETSAIRQILGNNG